MEDSESTSSPCVCVLSLFVSALVDVVVRALGLFKRSHTALLSTASVFFFLVQEGGGDTNDGETSVAVA